MLKRILQTCAAAALMASSALAGNAAGTYSAQTADGKLVVELRPLQDDLLQGRVHLANQDYPIIAKQFGDNLNGTWEFQGRHIQFTSSLSGHTLTLNTNGATYTLEKSDDVPPAPGSAPNAGGDVPAVMQSETREGRAFRYVLPQGWEARESDSGVDLVSRDGITSVSHAFFFSPGKSNPDEVFQLILSQADTMKWSDVKVESATPRNQNGALGKTYSLSYKFNGTPVRAEAVIIVYNEEKRNVARIVVLQATPEVFSRDEKMMMELAHKIEITHQELVDPDARQEQANLEERPANIRPHGDANELDDINQTYKAHEQSQEDASEKFDAMMKGRFETQPAREGR